MAKFLTTRGTASQIENIINTARKELVLISPYVRIPETLFQCIQDAGRRHVNIKMICRKSELKQEAISQLEQLSNLSLYFNKDLHAKCFYNEDLMVITSMNLYDYSEQHNKEMGVFITADGDKELYGEAIKEVNRIIDYSERGDLPKGKNEHPSVTRTQSIRQKLPTSTVKGYCIRCKTRIPYDFDAPYCPACYGVWKQWKDPNYEEKYCHSCGRDWKITTIDYPLCLICFRKRG